MLHTVLYVPLCMHVTCNVLTKYHHSQSECDPNRNGTGKYTSPQAHKYVNTIQSFIAVIRKHFLIIFFDLVRNGHLVGNTSQKGKSVGGSIRGMKISISFPKVNFIYFQHYIEKTPILLFSFATNKCQLPLR